LFVVIAYDISEDSRRNRIFKTLKDYGEWVQYSLFECELEKKDYLKLKKKLQKIIKEEEEDKVLFYFLCQHCERNIKRIGKFDKLEEDGVII